MKKILSLILVAVLMLSLVACDGGVGTGDTNTDTGNGGPTNTDTPSSGENSITNTHKVGDTVETNYYRFTLKDAAFTRNILVGKGEQKDIAKFRGTEEFFTPTDEPFVDEDGYVIDDIHGLSISADSDDVFLDFDLEVEFIGTEERTIGDMDFEPAVFYGDYRFTSDYMSFYRELEDDLTWFNFDSDITQLVRSVGLECGYFNGTFKPLSSPPIEIRGVIKVPGVVAEHVDNEVFISFAGEDFIIE